MSLDAADLIASFASGDYTVTRRAKATYVQGRTVPGATSTLTINASVQSSEGRDLLRLPEGRRSVDTQVVYTVTQLLVGAQNAPYESDLISIDGGTWEVQHCEKWVADTYYRALIQVSQ